MTRGAGTGATVQWVQERMGDEEIAGQDRALLKLSTLSFPLQLFFTGQRPNAGVTTTPSTLNPTKHLGTRERIGR